MAGTAGGVSASKVAKALSVRVAFPQKRAKLGSPGTSLLLMCSQSLGRCSDFDAVI